MKKRVEIAGVRKPEWLRKPPVAYVDTIDTRRRITDGALNTVCRSARCPNMGECYANGVAAFMILGEGCTRNCGFCSVDTIKTRMVDPDEPERVAAAATDMKLSHVVITSVTRDDLPDGGSGYFARTISAVRVKSTEVSVEVLTPDFKGNERSIDTVTDAQPDVYNHNIETVPELYTKVRPAAVYERSLRLLERVKERRTSILTKSGIMLGLGETRAQVEAAMKDLRDAGCDILTIGQYLRPTLRNLPVAEYIEPSVFDELTETGRAMGLPFVFSGPFVRSSYHAGEIFKKV